MSDGAFEYIRYASADGVARLTLDRPRVLNAMSIALREEVWTALDVFEADADACVLVIDGAGERAFSAGADISEFGTAPSLNAARNARRERDLWGRLLACNKPLLALLHGYVLGAGLELALCCDFRLAADDALLGLPEGKLAYLPSAGGSQTLPRLAGPGRALDLILSAEPIDATTALAWGIVSAIVSRDQLAVAGDVLARRLAAQPQRALRLAKRAVRDGLDLPLAQGLALESRLRALVDASS